MSSELLQRALPGSTLLVAVDHGKVAHRMWFSTGDTGLLEEPRSVSSLRPALDDVTGTVRRLAGAAAPVIAIEATGALHGCRVLELEDSGEIRPGNAGPVTGSACRRVPRRGREGCDHSARW